MLRRTVLAGSIIALGLSCVLSNPHCCRVGEIVEVSNHPSADTLYVEQINLGEDKPRQVYPYLAKLLKISSLAWKPP